MTKQKREPFGAQYIFTDLKTYPRPTKPDTTTPESDYTASTNEYNPEQDQPAWEELFPYGACVLCHRTDDRIDTSGHCYACSMAYMEWMDKISKHYPTHYAHQVAENYVYEPPFAEGTNEQPTTIPRTNHLLLQHHNVPERAAAPMASRAPVSSRRPSG